MQENKENISDAQRLLQRMKLLRRATPSDAEKIAAILQPSHENNVDSTDRKKEEPRSPMKELITKEVKKTSPQHLSPNRNETLKKIKTNPTESVLEWNPSSSTSSTSSTLSSSSMTTPSSPTTSISTPSASTLAFIKSKREELYQQIKLSDNDPSAWDDLITFELTNGNSLTPQEKLLLYIKATDHMSSDNPNDPFLVQIWIAYIQFEWQVERNKNETKGRFDYLKQSKIGTKSSNLYLAWAQFNVQIGKLTKACELLQSAISKKVQPVKDLEMELNRIQEIIQSSSFIEENNSSLTSSSIQFQFSEPKESMREKEKEIIDIKIDQEKEIIERSTPDKIETKVTESIKNDNDIISQPKSLRDVKEQILQLQLLQEKRQQEQEYEKMQILQKQKQKQDQDQDESKREYEQIQKEIQQEPEPEQRPKIESQIESKQEIKEKFGIEKEEILNQSLNVSNNIIPEVKTRRSPPVRSFKFTPLEKPRSINQKVEQKEKPIPLEDAFLPETQPQPQPQNKDQNHLQSQSQSQSEQSQVQSQQQQLQSQFQQKQISSQLYPKVQSQLPIQSQFQSQPQLQHQHQLFSNSIQSQSQVQVQPQLQYSHLQYQNHIQNVQLQPQHIFGSTITPTTQNVENSNLFSINGNFYTKLSEIGRGGSSKVYQVMGPDGKIYALKRVRLSKVDEATVQGYINEISLLNKFRDCETIVKLYDAEVNKEKGYIHMLLECGEIDLAKQLQKKKGKPLDENFVRLYWQQMLEAVSTIHEKRIIHSDLKPANFLLVHGTLKLIDFGISMTIQSDHTSILRENPAGTINYMSPEALLDYSNGQKRRCSKIGRPSDVWSLGCILYQMVFGAPPFSSIQGDLPKLHAIVNPEHKINFENITNQHLLQTLKSCLQRNPQQRATINQLLNQEYLHPEKLIPTRDVLKDKVEDIFQQLILSGKVNLEQNSIDALKQELLEKLAK